jgi:hypothetical protein
MGKKIFGLGLLFMAIGALAFADSMETLTLTTYYPAPYGVYFQLATKRLSVGLLTQADQPTRDGDIRLEPQTGSPTTAWPAGQPGQLAYSQDNDAFYHYNGSAWVADGGGSGTVAYLDCAWGPTYVGLSSCTPPACPAGWTSIGISN